MKIKEVLLYIFYRSPQPLRSDSTTVTVSAIPAPIFSSVEPVSKPSSVVLPQSSSAISLSSIAPAISTNTIDGFPSCCFPKALPISTTASTTNSNFSFTGTPSIPSSFEFGIFILFYFFILRNVKILIFVL